MKNKRPESEIGALVRVLDKTTRLMEKLALRMNVLDFGQAQIRKRLARLEGREVHRTAREKRRRTATR